MSEKIDHIIKKAIGDYEMPGTGDWQSFYDLWQAVEGFPDSEREESKDFDETVRKALEDADIEAGAPDWASFAALMETAEENAGAEEDLAFDEEVKSSLEGYANFPMDPDHWRKFSYRLDQLNNRPRMILMKVAEVAAVIFILYHLSYFYKDYSRQETGAESPVSITDRILGEGDAKNETVIPAPNDLGLNGVDSEENSPAAEPAEDITENESAPRLTPKDEKMTGSLKSIALSVDEKNEIAGEGGVQKKDLRPENFLDETVIPTKNIEVGSDPFPLKADVAEMLPSSEIRIDYPAVAAQRDESVDRLAMHDISLIRLASLSDTLLNMTPVFQVVRPRLHSTFETGIFADATTIQIQDSYSFSTFIPRNEVRLNPGYFMRYKIMYKNLYGSIGADYVEIKYSGLNQMNEIAMVSLPFELGYNIINVPHFRFYIGGGVAGRFVPVADYSSESFNLASDYNKLESKEKTNGLLKNGPFEINSYLSGRYTIGFDTNVFRNISVGLHYSHDFWLKGEGIGFNYDKFKSSHLGLGIGYQF